MACVRSVEVKVTYRQKIFVYVDDYDDEDSRIEDDVEAVVSYTPDHIDEFDWDDFSYKIVE